MNYYERHIGDYVRDTAHLTMLEHGAYTLLMDRYYATEAGIPADQAHRLARARTREEKAAVDAVLQEFFTLTDGVWTKRRIELEIEKARKRVATAKQNGRGGGRPPKQRTDDSESGTNTPAPEKNSSEKVSGAQHQKNSDAQVIAEEIHNENNESVKPTGLSPGSETETQTKAHQAPDTRHQLKPSTQQAASTTQPETGQQPSATAASPPDAVTERALQLVLLLRARGAALQAGDPRVRRWAADGVTDAQALQALDVAQQRRQDAADPSPINAGYLGVILADVVTAPAGRSPPLGNRPMSREDSRRIAATTRLSDFREACAAEQRGQTDDDSRTIEADASRLLG